MPPLAALYRKSRRYIDLVLLRAPYADRHSAAPIVANTIWLLLDPAIRFTVGLVVAALMARLLGPGDFGLYSYGVAFILLFRALSTLGLNGIVTRDLVREPERQGEILGTTFLLRSVGGVCAVGLAVLAISFIRSDDPSARLIVMVLSVGLLLQSFDTIELWFHSQIKAVYAVSMKLAAFLISAGIKIGLVVAGATVIAFAWALLAEMLLVAAGLTFIWRKKGPALKWRIEFRRGKRLLRESWPLILSALGATIYLKIDQIMLGELVGDVEVGLYAVAAQLSEAWYFVPTAVATSVFPILIVQKKSGHEGYHRFLQRLCDLLLWVAVSIALLMTAVGGTIIELVFGGDYALAGTILAIHVWAGLFIFMRAVLSKWLIAEELVKFSLLSHGLGAAVNIALNLLLIPAYGAIGAAAATVASYATASYLVLFLHPRTRGMGVIMTKAFIAPYRLARSSSLADRQGQINASGALDPSSTGS